MDNLTMLRKQKNLRQRDVADAMHVSQNVMSNYENGLREPPIDLLVRLADFFGVSVDYLLGHDSPDAPTPDIVRVYDALTPRGQMLLMGYAEGLLAAEGKELSVVLSVPQTARKFGQN